MGSRKLVPSQSLTLRRVGLLSYLHIQADGQQDMQCSYSGNRQAGQDAGSPAFKRSVGRGHRLELPVATIPQASSTLQFTLAKEMK